MQEPEAPGPGQPTPGPSSDGGADDPATALLAMLAAHPGALVAAVGEDGLFVPTPPSIPTRDHRSSAARSALDLVQPGSRQALIDAWATGKADGVASAVVALLGTGAPATFHVFDVTSEHGVYAVVVVPGEASEQALDAVAEIEQPPPRLARTRKDEMATIVDVDPAVTEMLGWTPDEMLGKSSLGFVHPDDAQRAIDLWMECLTQAGSTCRTRLRHRHRDGRWVWMELANTNLLDARGYVDCEMFDISDEMTAHDAVRASEQLLRRLAESLPVGVSQFDRDFQIIYANQRLYEILGADQGLAGDVLSSAVVEREELQRAMLAVMEDGEDTDMRLQLDRLDGGGRRLCTLSVRALTNDDGAVVGGVLVLHDVTEEALLRSELERRATFDALTGCLNRQASINRLDQALAAPPAPDHAGTAVVFVDLDGFKQVNDEHGHATGDAVLSAVAGQLRAAVRSPDVVGRLGGDEFLVVCPEVEDQAAAAALGDRVADAISKPVEVGSLRFALTASVGVAWTGAHRGMDADALIAEADAAMYAAKRSRPEALVVVTTVEPRSAVRRG